MAKTFIALGVIFIILGFLMLFFDKFELFKLPGDIYIQEEHFSLYFPITSMIIISILLTILLNIISKFFK